MNLTAWYYQVMRRVLPFASVLACLAGCVSTKPIIVPVGRPVLIVQPVTIPAGSAAVMDDAGDWRVSDSPVTLPAGWASWYLDERDLR